jgi:hypothetical protein
MLSCAVAIVTLSYAWHWSKRAATPSRVAEHGRERDSIPGEAPNHVKIEIGDSDTQPAGKAGDLTVPVDVVPPDIAKRDPIELPTIPSPGDDADPGSKPERQAILARIAEIFDDAQYEVVEWYPTLKNKRKPEELLLAVKIQTRDEEGGTRNLTRAYSYLTGNVKGVLLDIYEAHLAAAIRQASGPDSLGGSDSPDQLNEYFILYR